MSAAPTVRRCKVTDEQRDRILAWYRAMRELGTMKGLCRDLDLSRATVQNVISVAQELPRMPDKSRPHWSVGRREERV